MAFKARFNFSVYLEMSTFIACISLVLCSGCKPKKTQKSTTELLTTDSVTSNSKELNPPQSFILELTSAATTIISLQLTQVDAVRGTTKIFSGRVLESYKGGLAKGSLLQYAGMSEKNYTANLSDTLIVFLTRHLKPLLHVNRDHVYYSTVEDNAMIKPYAKLDSLLRRNILPPKKL